MRTIEVGGYYHTFEVFTAEDTRREAYAWTLDVDEWEPEPTLLQWPPIEPEPEEERYWRYVDWLAKIFQPPPPIKIYLHEGAK